MAAVGLVGGGLAVASAADTHWYTHVSLSRLGVDPGASAIMNATLLLLGTLLVALGLSLEPTLARLRSAGRLSSRTSDALRIGFIAAGVAVSVTGVFHNDGRLPYVIHNLAGFTTPLVLTATILGGRFAVGGLGRRFDRGSIAIPSLCICLFLAAYLGHLLPYAVMEASCFGLIGAWLWAFEARLHSLAVPT
jgi:hypothetical membrane protein